jgi:cobalamin biosynthesis protein CobD/CbiB
MTLISLVLVFVLEQVRPLPLPNAVQSMLAGYVDNLSGQFNAGERRQGAMAWLLAVAPLVIVSLLLYYLLGTASVLLAIAFNVVVLYFLMGFRQFSGRYNAILEALRNDDIDAARETLANWRNKPAEALDSTEVAKLAIEEGLTAAHRQLFGVMFWFIVLPGPAGAALYGLAAMLNEKWGRGGEEYVEFGSFARKAFDVLDWIPSRLTAITFAIVGDFEDAIYCWRTQSNSWGNLEQGIVLAAGAGALGVRLGEAVHEEGSVAFRPELGLGDEADVEHMASGVGLVWRSLLIWMFLIALVTLVTWFS